MHCLVVAGAGGKLPLSLLPLPRTDQSADLALTMSAVHYHFSEVTAIAGTPAKKKMGAGVVYFYCMGMGSITAIGSGPDSISFSRRPAVMLHRSAPSQVQGYADSYAVIL